MEHQFALDPYEQQLLKVFDSHDRDRCGSLDRDGLVQLCQTLQLEEHSQELIRCLLKDNKYSRASFTEFRDALLALLGNMQNNKNHANNGTTVKDEQIIKEPEKGSPEREVSPKYVYGSKKYGRRSRPRNDDVGTIFNDQNEITNKTPVQRSNSQIEVSYKKRKTNYKLQRCTSLPTNNDLMIDAVDNGFMDHELNHHGQLVCSEKMLREAWKNLGVGDDGFLNQEELVLVCDAIGLHKLAEGVIRQLSDKLTLDYNHRISFQELLEVLQQDDTWYEVLNPNITGQQEPVTHRSSTDKLFPDSQTFQFVTLGPDGNGVISTDVLIEMWENVGIHSPKELLHELGFNTRTIKIAELAELLDKQIKTMNDSARSEYQSPHITLLQASLSLYQSEIRCFKGILEQMHAEREKLKLDVVEANNRATMLAQEVDDNHSRMEQNTLNQVKLLEQRHNDILKEGKRSYQLSGMNKNKLATAKPRLRFKEQDDLALLREVLSINPFESPNQWQVIQEHLSVLTGKTFSIKTMRDHIILLIQQWTEKTKGLQDRSGIEESYSEKDQLCEQIKEMIGEAAKKKITKKPKTQENLGAIMRDRFAEQAIENIAVIGAANEQNDDVLVVDHNYFSVPEEIVVETAEQDGIKLSTNSENESESVEHKNTCKSKFGEKRILRNENGNTVSSTACSSAIHGSHGEHETGVAAGQPIPERVRARTKRINTQKQGLAYLDNYDKQQYELKKTDQNLAQQRIDIDKEKLALESRRLALEEKKLLLEEYEKKKVMEILENKIQEEKQEREFLMKIIEKQELLISNFLKK